MKCQSHIGLWEYRTSSRTHQVITTTTTSGQYLTNSILWGDTLSIQELICNSLVAECGALMSWAFSYHDYCLHTDCVRAAGPGTGRRSHSRRWCHRSGRSPTPCCCSCSLSGGPRSRRTCRDGGGFKGGGTCLLISRWRSFSAIYPQGRERDRPGDHRAELPLLLHLQPVEQAGRWPLHRQAQHMDLDNGGRWDLDHPHAQ